MSTISKLGSGVLHWPETAGWPGAPGMVALRDPSTGHRLALVRVPVSRTGLLIAVLDTATLPALPALPGLHAKKAATVSLALASGTVKANQPAPGIGPADLVGCAPEDSDFCWLDPDTIGFAVNREVRLEIHRGCNCAPVAHSTTPAAVV